MKVFKNINTSWFTNSNLNPAPNLPTLERKSESTLQDLFLYPTERYLLVEGRLQKHDGTAYADVNLIHNGIMYLFKTICYRLSGQQIEHINDPGIATTMLGMLTYHDDFSKSYGLNQSIPG